MTPTPAYEELHREAEAQGFIVHLTQAGRGERSRLARLVVLNPRELVDGRPVEVAALRVRPDRPLETAAERLVWFLRARREAEA